MEFDTGSMKIAADIDQEIKIAGFGGQGVVLAGYVLGKAVALYADQEAVMTQSHGPEARGGATRSDVIISSSEIHFPKVIQPNVLVCLTQQAYNKFYPILRPGGLLITDPPSFSAQSTANNRSKPGFWSLT